jgi:hypothetical protein
MSTHHDPLIHGSLKRLLAARKDWTEARRKYRAAGLLFNEAAEDFFRAFGDEFDEDICYFTHLIDNISITIDEDWRDFKDGDLHMALRFNPISSYGGEE